MAKPKKPRIPNAKLTKAKKAPKVSTKPKPFHMTVGTRNEPGPRRDFTEIAELKREATKAINEHIPWCDRYNRAGKVALGEGRMAVDAWFGIPTRVEIEACFDEYTGMTIKLILWRD